MTKKHDSVPEFVTQTSLDNSLLVGYYGGGNFGDELLLEILLHLLKEAGTKNAQIYYLNPQWYKDYHQDFGYDLVNAKDIPSSVMHFLKARNIIIGGGGLWGLDMNPKALFMSLAVWFGRFVLRKRVYLLGVGYYNSTNKVGRFAAFCASHAANTIFARDQESYENFSRHSQSVFLDKDFSSYIPLLQKQAYDTEIRKLQSLLPPQKNRKILLIAFRNFKGAQHGHYKQLVSKIVQNNSEKTIALFILEPKEVNPEGYKFIRNLAHRNPHVTYHDFRYNSVGFFYYLALVHKKLIMVAPHYHALAAALQGHVPFLPIVYDNKSEQLLLEHGYKKYYWLRDLSVTTVQTFIDGAYDS